MNAQPHDASSIEELEKKTPGQNSPPSKASVAEGQANSPNSEYERYLDLHRQFEGAGRKRLLQKLDWRLLPTLSVLYLLCSLDKSNAGNAKIFGFVTNANMTSTQFNLGLMVFFFSYGLWEPVSNVLLRRLGPKIWFPIIIVTWGTITTLTCLCRSFGAFIAIRLALGIAEAGLYPGSYFILSMWYTPKELATRMAIFYGANTAAGAFSGVIAYGVGHLDGSHGYTAWEWLFLIEGVITVAVGLMTIFFLPHFPHQYNETRKTSWLTSSELDYAKLRVKYASGPDAPTYEFRWSDVWAAARDRKTWLMMMMFWWGGSIPTYSLSYTLPTMVKNLGYSAIRAQALTTPPYIFATIVCIFNGWMSDHFQKRYASIMACYAVGLTGIVILWISVHFPQVSGVSYFAIFIAAAGYSAQAPIVGAWTSNNIPNPSKRAASIGFLMLFGSVGGGGIGSNIYLEEQAPVYPLGFGFSVGATVLGAMIPATIHWCLMRRENERRDTLDYDRILSEHSQEELSSMEENSPLYRYTL
ncbi:major facilitator superfamily transporter [Colletotrichum gloeosporioides Cg-14]|uniref:Major facilitator superfamily transporter n=1 Tax=Colletotrichum gloeosporioides (strain Cg-14) TaxID=1237896 RepID=T0KYL6_COLGC|nr:major facilitator superfamily transporter [Colletotrichum gloeosporioides Cg-14]